MEKIVNFSGGRSSGYMVNMVKDEKPIYIFCNTSKETPETYEFINECDKYFNMNLIVLEYMPKSFRITTIKDCKKNGEVFNELIKYTNANTDSVSYEIYISMLEFKFHNEPTYIIVTIRQFRCKFLYLFVCYYFFFYRFTNI